MTILPEFHCPLFSANHASQKDRPNSSITHRILLLLPPSPAISHRRIRLVHTPWIMHMIPMLHNLHMRRQTPPTVLIPAPSLLTHHMIAPPFPHRRRAAFRTILRLRLQPPLRLLLLPSPLNCRLLHRPPRPLLIPLNLRIIFRTRLPSMPRYLMHRALHYYAPRADNPSLPLPLQIPKQRPPRALLQDALMKPLTPPHLLPLPQLPIPPHRFLPRSHHIHQILHRYRLLTIGARTAR